NDDAVNVGDAVFIIAYIFRGGPAPSTPAAADANGDGSINIGDAVYLIGYIFRSGPAPKC
ncbi:MAG: dockerin type I repeat-containing protein, partial [candidate division Zixibacteria bacterium]|nr:dockerin type I repeat-containing protein [candidate division Zixibacteria bacterium]